MSKIYPILIATIITLMSNPIHAEIIFKDNFESNPHNWECKDGRFSMGTPVCGIDPTFGSEFRMGPGRNGGNALYSYKKRGVPNGYRGEARKWLTGNELKKEVYHRWYMKVPPAEKYNKQIKEGFKFWRYITKENGYSSPPQIYLNVSGWDAHGGNGTFAGGVMVIYSSNAGYLPLTPVSDFNDGEWHSHELRIRVNSDGRSDGLIQYWLNGELKATHENISFSRIATNQRIHCIGVGVGNVSDSDWYQNEWSAIAFDDIVISTEYVGSEENHNAEKNTLSPPSRIWIKENQ